MTEDLRQIWGMLAFPGPRSEELRVHELEGIELPAGPPLLGIDAAGQRHLLMPIPSGARVVEDTRSGGVQIVAHQLIDRVQLRLYVDVVCRKPHLHELFSVLASEIVAQLGREAGQPDLVSRSVLDRWRELLEAEPSEELSFKKLVGLFGELWHLRELVRCNPLAVGCWMGPSGARYDFVGRDLALEVKSTTARYGRLFEIHGEMQLEPPAGGNLYLAANKLEEVPAGGESAGDLVESMVSMGADRHDLLARLGVGGIHPDALERLGERRFRVIENRVYAVSVGFPRITSASFASGALPAGVLKLRYEIDLTTEPPYPLLEDEIAAVYRALTAEVSA
jgi:putative PD-(D/E)XK family protein DUF4420